MCSSPIMLPEMTFFYLIFIYTALHSFCIYLRTLHFRVQALPVIINLKQILAFSSSTRCPLTRNIASFCRILYLPCVMYSRMYMLRCFHGVCFFTPRWRKIVREKTRVFFHDTRLLSRSALSPRFVVSALVYQTCLTFLSSILVIIGDGM